MSTTRNGNGMTKRTSGKRSRLLKGATGLGIAGAMMAGAFGVMPAIADPAGAPNNTGTGQTAANNQAQLEGIGKYGDSDNKSGETHSQQANRIRRQHAEKLAAEKAARKRAAEQAARDAHLVAQNQIKDNVIPLYRPPIAVVPPFEGYTGTFKDNRGNTKGYILHLIPRGTKVAE